MQAPWLIPIALATTGCIVRGVEVRPLAPVASPDSVVVRSPLKAQLADGATVLFRTGAVVRADVIQGLGARYDATLRDSMSVEIVPRDSVVALVAYRTDTREVQSIVRSYLAGFGIAAALVAIAIAIDPPTFCCGP